MRSSEDEIIARHLAPLAGQGAFGLRDDAALVPPRPGHELVVTKDMLVADVHFFADDAADSIARKALRVNLSDLAAKGAKPTGFLLGLALPSDWTEAWLERFVAGLADDARAFECPLLGGDTVATPGPLTLSITAFGEVGTGRMVPRTGTQAGDLLYVSGTIGDAALGLEVRRDDRFWSPWLAQTDAGSRASLLGRYLRPEPRLALAPALAHARAAMDVSDGFLGDLAKMLALEGLTATLAVHDIPLSAAARVAIALDPRLIGTALAGGDDYEILCAVPPVTAALFEAAARVARLEVTRIGVARRGAAPVEVRDGDGALLPLDTFRFQHFA